MAAAQYGTEIDPAWLDELIGTFDKDQSGMIELCEFRELFQARRPLLLGCG
jgi:Ca2+-binding EF-hand superfamily protein